MFNSLYRYDRCIWKYWIWQKYGPESGGGGGGGTQRGVTQLRDQIKDLEKQNDDYRQEIKDLQRDLASEKRAAEKVTNKIEIDRIYIFRNFYITGTCRLTIVNNVSDE